MAGAPDLMPYIPKIDKLGVPVRPLLYLIPIFLCLY